MDNFLEDFVLAFCGGDLDGSQDKTIFFRITCEIACFAKMSKSHRYCDLTLGRYFDDFHGNWWLKFCFEQGVGAFLGIIVKKQNIFTFLRFVI